MRAIPSIAMAVILVASVILAGCGQKLIVLDTDRYTPQDPILGPLPGDPQGDYIFENVSSSACNDIRITFFPITLSTPGTGLSIPPGCSITIFAANHQFLSDGSAYRFYKISWLGYGDGGSVQAIVTPLFAGVVDNSRSSLSLPKTVYDIFHY